MQLVFGHDAILNIKHEADWTCIKKRKDKISHQNNIQEIKTWQKHNYKINDKVLIRAPTNLNYGTDAYSGPFKITKVNNNGTVIIKMGCIEDTYKI